MVLSGSAHAWRRGGSRLLQWLRARQRMLNWAAAVGTVILIGICTYRRVWHPGWLAGEALLALWPLYLAGGVSIAARWLVRDVRMDETA